MSVANQANDTLNKLLQSSLRVEMLLKSDDKKSKTGSGVTGIAESAKDAVALTGLSTSMTKLIKAADKASPKVGEKLKDFLVNFSEGIKTAVESKICSGNGRYCNNFTVVYTWSNSICIKHQSDYRCS